MRPSPSRVTMAALAILGLASPAWAQSPRKPADKPAAAPATKVDLNTASAAELEELPGIGAARAESIIKARPFKAVEDLKSVKGISPAVYEGLADRVRVAPKAVEPKPAPKPKETEKEKEDAPSPAHKLDLNKATAAELEELPGIGAARAENIIKARPFKAVEDLKAVKGISPAVYSGLADRVHVVAAPAPKPAPTPAAKPVEVTRPTSTTPKETAKPKKATLAPGEKVNLNKATAAELEELPGIGPVYAGKIIEARPFAAIEDIMKVKGIKEVEFGKIKDMITVK